MGMFDREKNLTSQEWVRDGFTVESAEYIGVVKSAQYGDNQKARVSVVNPSTNERESYVCFGVLADQISRMDAGDLPARVKIEKDGDANVFVKAD